MNRVEMCLQYASLSVRSSSTVAFW